MITCRIYLERYDWTAHCYFAVDRYYLGDIISHLKEVGAPRSFMKEAYRSMENDSLDKGLCYSSMRDRESVFVVGKASSAAEYFNSICHEIGHLVSNICEAYGIDPSGEEPCYLAGDIAMQLYPYCRSLICESCLPSVKIRMSGMN